MSTTDGGSGRSPEEAAQARVARLVERAAALDFPLGDDPGSVAATLLAYQHEMLVENQRVNLTGIRDPEQADVLHALDSLAFARTGLRPEDVLDIGTGNGFPGVAVSVLHLAAEVTLVDRTGKKIVAIERALEAVELEHIETAQLDIEQALGLHRDWRDRFDVVTSRATATVQKLGRWADPLLAPGGHLVLWVTPESDRPEDASRKLRLTRTIDYELPAVSDDGTRARQLLVYEKR